MTSPKGFSEKAVDLGSRSFSIRVLEYENGCFISVTEGTPKLGSMVVSLSTGQNSVTTTVIPSKSESLFLKLIAERISNKMRGIAIVSTNLQKDLDPGTAKGLMIEITEIIQN